MLKRSLSGAFLFVICLIVILSPALKLVAAEVTLICNKPKLVQGKTVYVIQHKAKRDRQNSTARIYPKRRGKSISFDRKGTCKLSLKKGTYRFDVLYQSFGKVVALTSGKIKIKSGSQEVKLTAGKPGNIQTTAGRLHEVRFRIPGDRYSVRSPGKTKVVMSPGKTYPIRLKLKMKKKNKTQKIVLWLNQVWLAEKGSIKPIDVTKQVKHHLQFVWDKKQPELKKITKAKATFYLPAKKEQVELLIGKDEFLTNRSYLEMSYQFTTPQGERIVFKRRPRFLKKKIEKITIGGLLKPSAYAKIAYKWADGDGRVRALLWGAELHNKHGDVVNVFAGPYQRYLSFVHPVSTIDWHAKIKRKDKKELPDIKQFFYTIPYAKQRGRMTRREEIAQESAQNISVKLAKSLGHPGRLDRVLEVDVSYKLYGKKYEKTISLAKWVTWRTKRSSLEAPPTWAGRAPVYLDKLDRLYDICKHLRGSYLPEAFRIVWTNNFGKGVTYTRRISMMEMGFFDMRERSSLYSRPDILVHEMLHGFGYGHGGPHNRAIDEGRAIFDRHDIYLMDHPSYKPRQIKILERLGNPSEALRDSHKENLRKKIR